MQQPLLNDRDTARDLGDGNWKQLVDSIFCVKAMFKTRVLSLISQEKSAMTQLSTWYIRTICNIFPPLPTWTILQMCTTLNKNDSCQQVTRPILQHSSSPLLAGLDGAALTRNNIFVLQTVRKHVFWTICLSKARDVTKIWCSFSWFVTIWMRCVVQHNNGLKTDPCCVTVSLRFDTLIKQDI